MKHPETRVIDVVCANCGESHRLRTTSKSMSVDICSSCHPAYTGVAISPSRTARTYNHDALAALATVRRR